MIEGQIETLKVDGVTLSIDSVGSGPTVLCLHAVGHDGHDFDALAGRLGNFYKFVRLDWPGHGQSGSDHKTASAGRYTELAEKVIDMLGLVHPVILGNSVGGAAAIKIAARRPVRALVLCDSGGFVEMTPFVARICRLFEGFYAAGARDAWWFKSAFAMLYALVLRGPDAQTQRRRIIDASRRSAPVLRDAWASFGRPDADIRDLAASLTIPVWVAWARSDRLIPLQYCRPAIDRLRCHTLTVFDGGHSPFLEQPHAFADQFHVFMKTLPPCHEVQRSADQPQIFHDPGGIESHCPSGAK